MTEEKSPESKVAGSNVAILAEHARKKSRKKKSTSGGEAHGDDRPVIRIKKGSIQLVLDEADQVLAERDPTIYAQSSRLVRILTLSADNVGREKTMRWRPGSVVIREISSAHLVDRMARAARWERWDNREKEWLPTDVPRTHAESFIARAGDWKHIPPLTGVIEAPTLRVDGSVLDQPGYDATSGIYFAGRQPAGYAAPIEQPTMKDAEKACGLLLDIISDFPTIELQDRSAVIAGMLTALLRRSLPAAPMIAITAPMPGTGKSKLADVMAVIATGRRAPVLSLGKDEAEGDKRLAAALLAGGAVVNLDNIERPLFGDLLCQALTQETVDLRPLGGSLKVTAVPNCVFLATGNNLDIRGDLKRRIVLVRLDAKMERPEQRKFDRDVVDVVTERRGELITACLTVVRAYLAAGCPAVNAAPFGGFEAWDARCRRPLIWLGIPDPLLSSEEARAEDPDTALQRSFFTAWNRAFGNNDVSATEIAQRAVEATKGGDGQAMHTNPDLYEAVLAACGEKITSKRLGYWLRRHKMRVCDGYRLVHGEFDEHSKIAKWRLERVGG